MEECEREPQCRNCGGPHVALSNECPKRQIPKNKTNQRQRSQQGRASYAAAAKLDGAARCGLGGRTLKFIDDFLDKRRFKVKIGNTMGPEAPNNRGVPQGAVISPTLFNMVMADLPTRLRRIQDLGFTIYADDVTLWTKGGSLGEQEQIMQRGIDEVTNYLEEVGMEPSPEKTQYMVVARPRDHRKGIAHLVQLQLKGQTIGRQPSIKILGVTFEETARSTKWLPELEKTWNQTLKLIRKTTGKSWGADEKAIRIMAEALLTSKALYSCNWMNLNRTQWKKIERLNHQTMRIVTGLPKYTPLEDLRKYAGMNTIEEQAEAQKIAHFQRLERTAHGRRLLEILGYAAEGRYPLEDALPPWKDIEITDNKTIPKQGMGRKAFAAKKHNKWLEQRTEEERKGEIRYTNAAKNTAAVSIAWTDETGNKIETAKLSEQTSVREAELKAILAAAEDIKATLQPGYTARIFTDSQQALKACRNSRTRNRTVKTIKIIAKELKKQGSTLIIEWLPGHTGILGNERAHQAAAEAASSTSSATGLTSREEATEETPIDPEERAELAKEERKLYLKGLLLTVEDPIPQGYTRWENVRLRRIRTGTALTPARKATFTKNEEGNEDIDPVCKKCIAGGLLTTTHMLWVCKSLGKFRQDAWASLASEAKPRNLEAWTDPKGQAQHRKQILDSLIRFIRTSGVHQFI
ncbi:uncharacterized protein ISCGN_014755 [Ixodes scapularis]